MATATAGFRAIHAKSIKALAWASFVFAFGVSAMLPATFVGDFTRSIFKMLPNYRGADLGAIVAVIILIVGLIASIVDVWLDLEPNQVAVYYVLFMGCVASTLTGGIADWFTNLSRTVLDAVDQAIFSAMPNGVGSGLLAVVAAIGIVLMTQRVVAKKGRRS
jgi:hypothetical protein